MSIQLEVADKPVKKYLKLALYGPAGSGKTHIALTFPDVVIVDTEAGTDFFRGRVAPFRVMKTKDFTQVLALVQAIEDRQITAGTLVLDSFTILNDVLREAAFKAAEKRALAKNIPVDDATVTPRDWGKIRARLNSLITRLYNLPCHTILTGWVRDIYEGEGNDLKKVGTGMDADRRLLYQPDLVLELLTVKGKHVGYVRKDRTGTFAVDSRLTDISYATTFAPLVEILVQAEAETTALTTEDAAAEAGTRLFDDPGLTILRETLLDHMQLNEADALWLLGAKLRMSIHEWAQVPPTKIPGLVDSLTASDPDAIRHFVAQNRKGA
jgi:hypothetical protein